VGAEPDQVFDLISDPKRLTEWWPRVTRVEAVEGRPGAARTRWTNVLTADSGRRLRLDYRCVASNRPERYEWEHELEGTPFADHLVSQSTRVRLSPYREGTRVEITSTHALRGSARIAGFAMRKTQRQMLDAALAGLERAFDKDAPDEPSADA
jgi:uncharacterized protein YndB with AHSA1/START domain